jgi:cell division protein ZapA
MNTQVEIFGAKYTFDGDDPEHIRQLAEYVNAKMDETAQHIKNVTTSKVAVLAAMNLAEEVFTLRSFLERSTKHAADRLDQLAGLAQNLGSPPHNETPTQK